ncbi:DUF262 domain-containing protein [Rheinheimera tilapiae]|uniref:DUF262 domain-containing protein n=1 Tax=Rheinheimera tilapiae TaxID=875043 RepID=A0ABV6BG10_9GAMM
MKTELLTVSKIFNENIFRIPDYQRGYSWNNSQLEDFWSDIEQLDEEKRHYTGVLTLEDVPESSWKTWEEDAWIMNHRNFRPYYIVDGQQRITTITIAIFCIIKKFEAENSKFINHTMISDLRRKYIFDCKADSIERSYIFGYEKDNPSYEYLKSSIFEETSSIHHATEYTIYTKNLMNAKEFFLRKNTTTIDIRSGKNF